MADVEHKNLTGSALHEPKGVATASANQVYVSDGGGSGAWTSQAPAHAQAYVQGNSTATSISASGAGNEVAVNFGSGITTDISDNFTVGANGLITYDGSITRLFYVVADLNGDQSSGATKEYDFLWAKNGTVNEATITHVDTDGTNMGTFSISGLFSLANADTVQLYVRNITDTTNITVEDCSIIIHQLGF